MSRHLDIEANSSAAHKQSSRSVASPRAQHIDGPNLRIAKPCDHRRWIFRQPQRRRKIISTAAGQNSDHYVAPIQSITADAVHHRLHSPISAHRKNQSRPVRNRHANARLHLRRARSDDKLRRHLHLRERTANAPQIPFSTPRARSRIHEHNTLRFVEKFGKFAHVSVMLTNNRSLCQR